MNHEEQLHHLPDTPNEANSRDDALFEELGKNRKKRKRKLIRIVLTIVAILAIILILLITNLRRHVREEFGSNNADVLSYTAGTGTISTVVSGSGILANVDTEIVSLPTGVEIDEILVSSGDPVQEGDLLATVEMSTVRTAMSDLQDEIESLDEEISDAEGDKVSTYLKAGVTGRVKIIYAEKEDDVASVMVEHGALAVLSLDGYMAVDIETEYLSRGDKVSVILADETEITGHVDSVIGKTATVLVSDNGPDYGEAVTVQTEDGKKIGEGSLYIHNPFSVTGYAGTVSYVNVKENTKVYSSTGLFTLKNTSTTANYNMLLRTRSEMEETLLELLKIQRYGGLTAPISGSVFSVADLDDEEEDIDIVTLSPDISMSVTITVDESDILALQMDQEADVTVSSVTEDTLLGVVTEIDKTASEGYYTAVITLDKEEGMLSGMTADVDVKIQGVENAVLIPVEAIHQTSTGAFVYTSYDTELKEYGGRVDVVTGLSNDSYIEIKSGLNVGDTVYYTEATNIFEMFANMSGMGGGAAGGKGGSQRPGGNEGVRPEMPAAGGQGGMPGSRG